MAAVASRDASLAGLLQTACIPPSARSPLQGPAPIRPLFGGAEAVTGRHLMAASEESATVTAVGSQMVGTTGSERLALSLPSGWIAGVVVAGAVGMVAVAAALLMRGRPSAGPLPL